MLPVKKLDSPVADCFKGSANPSLFRVVGPSNAADGGFWLDVASRQRARLWELPPSFLCSVVGTCLTLAEARRFVTRRDGPGAAQLGDLELHERLVKIAGDPDAGGRELNKHLDRRYDVAIRRFDKAKDDKALLDAWARALTEGDIPGAYWAAMTHRSATSVFRHNVFGDVHMLSHLVGAANRADVRRLTELQRENAELKEKVERQQARMRDLATTKEAVIKGLEDRLSHDLASRAGASPASEATDETEVLRGLVASLKAQLDQKNVRVDQLARKLTHMRTELVQHKSALEECRNLSVQIAEELASLETTAGASHTQAPPQEPTRTLLHGRTVFYCGGRPGNIEAIKRWVESGSGHFLHHDGGKEERIGLMASLLQGADVAVFPVDCVSHDAMGALKRLCRQIGKPYRALRTSSLASFVHAMRQVDSEVESKDYPGASISASHGPPQLAESVV